MEAEVLEKIDGLSLEEVKSQALKENGSDTDSSALIQLIIFELGGEEYALHIDQVKEIVLTPGMAKMPQTPDYIKGVANIRGTIIAMMDLEQKFGLKDSDDSLSKYKYTLVIESDSHKVGILVKNVPSTLSIRESSIEKSADIVQYSSLDQNCIEGIAKTGDRLIILIDILAMVEADDLTIPSLNS